MLFLGVFEVLDCTERTYLQVDKGNSKSVFCNKIFFPLFGFVRELRD